jgi:hypothetical protein
LSDFSEVVFALNTVHEKIFGKKEELVNVEIDNSGVSYFLIKNPYVSMHND